MKIFLVWYNSVLEDFTVEEMRLSEPRNHYSNSNTTIYKQKMNIYKHTIYKQ